MKISTRSLLFLVFFPNFIFSQNYDVELEYKIYQDKSVKILYTKNKPGTYTVYLHFPKLVNAHQQRIEKEINSRKGSLYCIPSAKSELLGTKIRERLLIL